jgi:hypothetical protein
LAGDCRPGSAFDRKAPSAPLSPHFFKRQRFQRGRSAAERPDHALDLTAQGPACHFIRRRLFWRQISAALWARSAQSWKIAESVKRFSQLPVIAGLS